MLLAKYGWLWLLTLGPVNAWLVRRSVRTHIAAHPELAEGYRRLIRGLGLCLSLPWAVMGVGCTVGGVPTVFNFLDPVAGGPFVWAWWVVLYAEFVWLGWWAVWGGGAEALVRHPGVVNFRTDSVPQMQRCLVGTAVFAAAWNTGFLVWLA